jgi:hypothetical protein
MTTSAQPIRPRFHPGLVLATPGATEACTHAYLSRCLARHLRGDWGTICDEDRQCNEVALRQRTRVLSAYPIDPTKPCLGHGANCLWILTEGDRSVTTMLLPDEY